MELNKTWVAIDAAPVLIENRTFVPLSVITDCFGIKTEWDRDNYAAYLDSDEIVKQIESRLYFKSEFAKTCRTIYDAYLQGEYGEELYLLVCQSLWGGKIVEIILIYKKQDVITAEYYDIAEYYGEEDNVTTKTLSEEEFEDFSAFIEENEIDRLTDWDTLTVWDGAEYEYLHCKGTDAVSFCVNNPGETEGSEIYKQLVDKFYDIVK